MGVAFCLTACEQTTHKKVYKHLVYKKKKNKEEEKQRVALSSLGEFGGFFFFYALEGSRSFGCDEVEPKSRKSNKFPLQEGNQG